MLQELPWRCSHTHSGPSESDFLRNMGTDVLVAISAAMFYPGLGDCRNEVPADVNLPRNPLLDP